MPDVQADISTIRERLAVARMRGLAPDEDAAADAVAAALKDIEDRLSTPNHWWAVVLSFLFVRPIRWWQGSVIEAVYEQLHAARVMMVDVMDDTDLAAEVPGVVARAQQMLHADDPRRMAASAFTGLDRPTMQAKLRRLMADSFEAADRQYSQLRRFRNIVLLSFVVVAVLGTTMVALVAGHPKSFPLCFDAPTTAVAATDTGTATTQTAGAAKDAGTNKRPLNCPSEAMASEPGKGDVIVVALIGMMGGLISAVASIRNLRSSASPYDAPLALALLKLPFGALTAIGGIALIQGGFVPGLSDLDSQNQILTYALLFGAAQHLITRLLDQKAHDLIDGVPSKGTGSDPGKPTTSTTTDGAPDTPPPDGDTDDGETDSVAAELAAAPEEPEPDYRPNPYDGDEDADQDDDSPVMAPGPRKDHS